MLYSRTHLVTPIEKTAGKKGIQTIHNFRTAKSLKQASLVISFIFFSLFFQLLPNCQTHFNTRGTYGKHKILWNGLSTESFEDIMAYLELAQYQWCEECSTVSEYCEVREVVENCVPQEQNNSLHSGFVQRSLLPLPWK